MSKVALITGITGQDGSILAEQLLNKGYEVHGIFRRASSINPSLDGIISRVNKHYGDLTDASSINSILKISEPDEIYHLAAMSHVRTSFDIPCYTTDAICCGTMALLDSVKNWNISCKIYNASSSEMFGKSPPKQNELTPFLPCSPYACAKLFAHNVCKLYRESYGMKIWSGILFNHESERRLETFVTRKITTSAAKIKLGLQKELVLGNLDAQRDWGYAAEYTQVMHKMMQTDNPDDYVVATGETHSVKEFLEEVFVLLNLDWKEFVKIDQKYFRPQEIDCLCGDARKAEKLLNWKPTVTFSKLCKIMIDHDLSETKKTMR